jgi:hypothetical protein
MEQSMADKVVSVQLEWDYSPATYLEETILLPFDGGVVEISKGKAKTLLEPTFFERNQNVGETIKQLIENWLYAIQILTYRNFELTGPARVDILDNGKKIHYLEINEAMTLTSSASADIVVKDKDGNIISDSKYERLKKQQWFAEAVTRYRGRDAILEQMLKSYQMSVKDAGNELVHLYEVRDALAQRFNSKNNALKALGVETKIWNEIGEIANSLPIKQGRHRGKAAGQLRDADQSELQRGRQAASNLIESYLKYLELTDAAKK